MKERLYPNFNMNVKLWEGQRNCVQCDASFLPLVPLVFMRATALPVALVVVWDMHLFSLLGRRQPDTGVPRQSDVSAGVLLLPLQCWQAYCKGIPAIHFSVSSHDTCMHYHGCHGYTLGEGGWLFYKSVSVCHVSMCYPTEQGYNYCCLGNISAHLLM